MMLLIIAYSLVGAWYFLRTFSREYEELGVQGGIDLLAVTMISLLCGIIWPIVALGQVTERVLTDQRLRDKMRRMKMDTDE